MYSKCGRGFGRGEKWAVNLGVEKSIEKIRKILKKNHTKIAVLYAFAVWELRGPYSIID